MTRSACFYAAISAALLTFAAMPAHADLAPNPVTDREATVAISGQVEHATRLSARDLRAMPATEVTVSYVTGHGEEAGTFSGVELWTLLQQAVLIDGPGKGALLRHIITVTGRDGYSVVLSAGELAPDFEGKPVILAVLKDGAPLAPIDGIRLIVPGDKHGGRAVRDVVTIDVR